MAMLIIDVAPELMRDGDITLTFAPEALLQDLIADRNGETIALGAWESSGVWLVSALGEIVDWTILSGALAVRINISVVYRQPHLFVSSDRTSNQDRCAIDVLPPEAFKRLMVPENSRDADNKSPMRASEPAAQFVHAIAPNPSTSAYHRIASAYDYTCAISGMHLVSPDTGELEGEVVVIQGGALTADTPTSEALFLTSSLAFCFRHHLVAIGDEAHILRHPKLPAEMRLLLEFTNRAGVLRLPGRVVDRPSLGALAAHRARSGL